MGVRGLLVSVLAVGPPLFLNGCGVGEAAEAPSVQATPVIRQNMRITAEATGSVEPVRKVEVKSKASGEVLRLHVDVGDVIEPGTLMAEIDPRDVNNAYEQAVADHGVAVERARIAENQLARAERLFQAGVITEQEIESQRLDYANNQASLKKSETNLMLAELRKADVTIRAPSFGTVLSRTVEEGTVIQSASSNVSGGTALFVMANLEEVQIRVLVDETDMGQIRPGLEASVQVEAYPGRFFPGTVEMMEPQAVNQSNVTMFPVIVPWAWIRRSSWTSPSTTRWRRTPDWDGSRECGDEVAEASGVGVGLPAADPRQRERPGAEHRRTARPATAEPWPTEEPECKSSGPRWRAGRSRRTPWTPSWPPCVVSERRGRARRSLECPGEI
jgi:RND family efflux transporter MFP subunit